MTKSGATMRNVILAVLLTLWAVGQSAPLAAQDRAQSLADIRQELTVLWGQVQQLRTELSTTGFPEGAALGGGPLARIDAIELELQRLTSKTEELENRIARITRDGTNRIGDLEFRLCELEDGCDIGALGDTPSLGGVDNAAAIPTPTPPPSAGGPSLAIGEREQFDAAQTALSDGDFQTATRLFAAFAETYPGGPLTTRAHYLSGEAFESLGDMPAAARSYLAAFSSNPTGGEAPTALFKLGTSLAAIGQIEQACVTLGEVPARFAQSEAALDARSAMANLGCG